MLSHIQISLGNNGERKRRMWEEEETNVRKRFGEVVSKWPFREEGAVVSGERGRL